MNQQEPIIDFASAYMSGTTFIALGVGITQTTINTIESLLKYINDNDFLAIRVSGTKAGIVAIQGFYWYSTKLMPEVKTASLEVNRLGMIDVVVGGDIRHIGRYDIETKTLNLGKQPPMVNFDADMLLCQSQYLEPNARLLIDHINSINEPRLQRP